MICIRDKLKLTSLMEKEYLRMVLVWLRSLKAHLKIIRKNGEYNIIRMETLMRVVSAMTWKKEMGSIHTNKDQLNYMKDSFVKIKSMAKELWFIEMITDLLWYLKMISWNMKMLYILVSHHNKIYSNKILNKINTNLFDIANYCSPFFFLFSHIIYVYFFYSFIRTHIKKYFFFL